MADQPSDTVTIVNWDKVYTKLEKVILERI